MDSIIKKTTPIKTSPDIIQETAANFFQVPYPFPYQRLVIHNILAAAGYFGLEVSAEYPSKQIILLPTGAGKSLCFMLPALLLDGLTIIVFPLLSLIADQQRRMEEAKIPSAILKGGQTKTERREIFKLSRTKQIKVLLSNPETLTQPNVLKELKQLDISHLVIDEAHIISEWGDTFRPAYLKLDELLKELRGPLVSALTATASAYILDRIKSTLFPREDINVISANPDRPNIQYQVCETLSKRHALRMITRTAAKPAIIFCGSRKTTELTARELRASLCSKNIYFYHAGLTKEEKKQVEDWFFHSDDGILVSTCAYGMGVDKKNIRTVVHRDIPGTVESYLQESGRGGRDRESATAILLFSQEDTQKLKELEDLGQKERFRKLLNYAQNTRKCRRESLYECLDFAIDYCSGCDVCNAELRFSGCLGLSAGCTKLTRFYRRFRRRYSIKEMIIILNGSLVDLCWKRYLWLHPQFGMLKFWKEDEIEEALSNLSSFFSDKK